MRRLFIFLTMTVLLLTGCKKEESNVVQSIQFTNVDNGRLTLLEGENFRVRYTVEPASLQETAVLEWTSSNEEVATVKNGRISALFPGKADITASCGKASATVRIEVEQLEVTAFQIQSKASGFVGREIPIEVTEIEPSEASAASITWSVKPEDLAYAYVSEGQLYVKGRKPGTGTLIGEGEGVTKECSLEFKEYVAVEEVSLTPSGPIKLGYGEKVAVKCVVTPATASLPEVSWNVQPENLFDDVTINGTTLTLSAGSKEGEATVTATADGRSVSTRVTIIRPPVTGITYTGWKSHLSLQDGKFGNPSSFQIVARTLPEGTDAPITYASLDPTVATVSEDGLVTAKGHGVAYIKMTAEDYTAYRTVYVCDSNAFSWVVEFDKNWDRSEWVSGSGTMHSSTGYWRFRVYDRKSKVKAPNGDEEIHFDFVQVNWLYSTWFDTGYNSLPSKLQWSMNLTDGYHEFSFRAKDGQTYNGPVTLRFTYGPSDSETVVGPAITVYVSNVN